MLRVSSGCLVRVLDTYTTYGVNDCEKIGEIVSTHSGEKKIARILFVNNGNNIDIYNQMTDGRILLKKSLPPRIIPIKISPTKAKSRKKIGIKVIKSTGTGISEYSLKSSGRRPVKEVDDYGKESYHREKPSRKYIARERRREDYKGNIVVGYVAPIILKAKVRPTGFVSYIANLVGDISLQRIDRMKIIDDTIKFPENGRVILENNQWIVIPR